MNGKISVVINTLNEEKNIDRAINSVSWADEILVCDMYSDDNTAVIAKKLGAKIIFHKRLNYVEPARNFAVSKAENEWILVLDPDEEIPDTLEAKLKNIIDKPGVVTHIEIPRKNIIFGKWVKSSMWWPDNNTRFFKQGSVIWGNKIHAKPKTLGQGLTLPPDERWAIIHHHYESIGQFIDRMNRYTSVQARELKEEGYEFDWKDLIKKPLGEFLSRFFANRGFEDGVHGLALGLLQAFSHLVMYLKAWELKGFEKKDLNFNEIVDISKASGTEMEYWFKYGNLSRNKIKRAYQKAKNKLF